MIMCGIVGILSSHEAAPTLGVALKRNIQNLWWKVFVERRGDSFGIDAAVLMNERVWEASGHTGAGSGAADSPRVMEAAVTTSDGSITFEGPPDLSALVDASVSDGSIHTSLPITVQGKVGKSLRGTVGAGEGRVTVRTHDGSITIR